MRLLPRSFYARDAVVVARGLLGATLHRGGVVLRIAEVEAYCGAADSACHARHGRTERNAPLWGPPGRAYVYLCYGLHHMLNLVTGEDGDATAVLVRACEPVAGLATVRRRRGGLEGPALLTGPGKVGAALGLDLDWNGHPLFRAGGLEVRAGEAPAAIVAGPRIGIDYARSADRRAPWRLAVADSPWVTHASRLG